MLRRFFALIAFAAIAAPCSTFAQKPDPLYTASHQQLQVVKVVLAQQAAWNRGDLEGFLAKFKDADDTEAILGTPTHGMSAIRGAYRTNYPNKDAMGTIEYSAVEARELGKDFAVATGQYHLERGKKWGGPADGTFTEIFENTPAGWMIVFSETT